MEDQPPGGALSSILVTALLAGTVVIATCVACRMCCGTAPAPDLVTRTMWYDMPMPSSSTSLSSEWRRSPSPPAVPHPSPEPLPWPPPRLAVTVCQHPAAGDVCLAVTPDRGGEAVA